MTRDQIKAELRRSACEDKWPWSGLDLDAFSAALAWKRGDGRMMLHASDRVLRLYFLLVAEALED